MRENGPGPLPPREASALSPGGSHEHPFCQCQSPDHPAHVLGQEALCCRHEHVCALEVIPTGEQTEPRPWPQMAWGLSQVQHNCPGDLSTTSCPLNRFLLQDALLWTPCGARGTK